ncbi:MAG TPA: class I SAM-dependent methyltransferase [Baekduia sp.]|uniref:class I SAM-dependent methyltransferase n=1 Tax=Baekduia sp. TaxID=2600305 RepID=UPI002D76E3F2|nr:class I SAM-dependent methyltransferase [Baekduia sp.]HET6507684.1 class I SAM-dependent methyltransferase [Baekduia sp.]
MADPLYDRIGRTYATTRVPDPRLAAAIRAAIGDDARTLINVGAGAGAYEPTDLEEVVAVEPSPTMTAQRRLRGGGDGGGADVRVLQATAERLPLADDSVDVALAIFSDHHWPDRAAGLRELARVAARRVVLVNSEPDAADAFWLTREYLPGFLDLIPARYRDTPGLWRRELVELLGGAPVTVAPLLVPHDCSDGFYAAYWRRPEAYLDAVVRDNISVFHRIEHHDAIARLADDLRTGAWHARHERLLQQDALDVGVRIVVAELSSY